MFSLQDTLAKIGFVNQFKELASALHFRLDELGLDDTAIMGLLKMHKYNVPVALEEALNKHFDRETQAALDKVLPMWLFDGEEEFEDIFPKEYWTKKMLLDIFQGAKEINLVDDDDEDPKPSYHRLSNSWYCRYATEK